MLAVGRDDCQHNPLEFLGVGMHSRGRRCYPCGVGMDLVAVTSLKQFFKSLLDEALGQTGLDVAEVTEFYLANLLAEFAAADRLFAPDEAGGPGEPLAVLYHRAQAAEREERIRILRRLGDVSLYKAGFFAGALRASVVGQGYTIDMGRAAYTQVAVLAGGGFGEVYDELGRKFRPLVDVLEGIAARSAARSSPSGALRIYESWRRTGSDTLETVLVDAGLLPPRGGLPN